MRCKLDRTYLEALTSASLSPSATHATPEDVQAVQDEVDSLYAEILPVVQMSVENQYLNPAIRRVTSKNAQTLDHSSGAVDYVSFLSSPWSPTWHRSLMKRSFFSFKGK